MQMEEKTDRRRAWEVERIPPATRLSHCIVPSLPFNHVSCVVNTTETSHLKMGDYWDLDWIDRCACMDHLYIYGQQGRPAAFLQFVRSLHVAMHADLHPQLATPSVSVARPRRPP